jgi:hypothetical protein
MAVKYAVWQRHSSREAANADARGLRQAGWKAVVKGRRGAGDKKNWYDVYRSTEKSK